MLSLEAEGCLTWLTKGAAAYMGDIEILVVITINAGRGVLEGCSRHRSREIHLVREVQYLVGLFSKLSHVSSVGRSKGNLNLLGEALEKNILQQHRRIEVTQCPQQVILHLRSSPVTKLLDSQDALGVLPSTWSESLEEESLQALIAFPRHHGLESSASPGCRFRIQSRRNVPIPGFGHSDPMDAKLGFSLQKPTLGVVLIEGWQFHRNGCDRLLIFILRIDDGWPGVVAFWRHVLAEGRRGSTGDR